MTALTLDANTTLPQDGTEGALAGRVWRATIGGPAVVAIRPDGVFDITARYPTMRDLCETPEPAEALLLAKGERIGALDEILRNTPEQGRDPTKPWLLAPIDLQAIKAAGVTFAISMLERVIEERARGDLGAAAGIRAEITRLVGEDFSKLKPGSPEAMHLKSVLIAAGRLVAISRSRDRPGRRDLHQGPGHGGGRHGRRCRAAPRLFVEQSGTGSGAGGGVERPDRRRHARQ